MRTGSLAQDSSGVSTFHRPLCRALSDRTVTLTTLWRMSVSKRISDFSRREGTGRHNTAQEDSPLNSTEPAASDRTQKLRSPCNDERSGTVTGRVFGIVDKTSFDRRHAADRQALDKHAGQNPGDDDDNQGPISPPPTPSSLSSSCAIV